MSYTNKEISDRCEKALKSKDSLLFVDNKKDDKQKLLEALVRDLVDLASSCRKTIIYGNFPLTKLPEVMLLDSMCEEILKRFTQKRVKSEEVTQK